MAQPTFWGQYRAIDDAADPADLLAFLDAFASLEPIRRAKRRSLELLEATTGDRLLDIGCGLGEEVREMAALVGDSGRAVGVDSSELAIAEAQRRAGATGSRAQYVVGDAADLGFPPAAFDGCRADRTLQHLETPVAALREMTRVVRPGGRIVVTEVGSWIDGDADLDPSVTARVRDRFAPTGRDQGWIGHFVPLLLSRAGITDVAAEQTRGSVQDFSAANASFGIDRSLTALLHAGEVDEGAARTWRAKFEEAMDDGRITLVVATFHFAGHASPRAAG